MFIGVRSVRRSSKCDAAITAWSNIATTWSGPISHHSFIIVAEAVEEERLGVGQGLGGTAWPFTIDCEVGVECEFHALCVS